MQGAYGGAASQFLSRFIDPARGQFGAAPIDGAGGSQQDYLEFLRKKLGMLGLFGNSVPQGSQAQGMFGGSGNAGAQQPYRNF